MTNVTILLKKADGRVLTASIDAQVVEAQTSKLVCKGEVFNVITENYSDIAALKIDGEAVTPISQAGIISALGLSSSSESSSVDSSVQRVWDGHRDYSFVDPESDTWEIWDGTRDYSFVNPESDTWEIWTPEQYAGLMALSNGQNQYDYRPDLDEMLLSDKTVVLKADLYFNHDYEENYQDWVQTQNYYDMNTSRNFSANNLGYQTFLDGSVRNMNLNVARFKFDGGFHKLVGLFKDMYDGEDKSCLLARVSGSHNPIAAISNLTFENCVVKNGFSDSASYDVGASIMEVSEGTTVEAGKIRNLSANHCIVCAGCRSISQWNRSLFIRTYESDNANENRFDGMNINVRNSFLYGNDQTRYWSWSTAGIIVSGSGVRRLDLAYSFNNYVYQPSASVIDKRCPNTVTNPKLFAFGNTGAISSGLEPASQVINNSKEELIEAVNTDILTRATGELSLIDENGDFTGVCP
jgi:hypothetical protein